MAIKCPLCGFGRADNLLRLNCGNFDQSILYRFVRMVACTRCGHVYNQLSPKEIDNLRQYYEQEYAQINLGAQDVTGDRPGSDNLNAIRRYSHLYGLISPYIKTNQSILDVGCATGGFLDYLREHGFKKLYGIDMVKAYVKRAKDRGKYQIKVGQAESMPFKDESMSVLVMDQVLEHLIEPKRAFREARRVLTDGGLLCISVPDASKYGQQYFFDFFWFLMREHVQHFDIEHLKLLGASDGFEIVDYSRYKTAMMSDKMVLPALSVLFKLSKQSNPRVDKAVFGLRTLIMSYIKKERERTARKKKIIDRFVQSGKPLYLWGLGRECLYLYENAGLKRCNIVGLIDNNSYKLRRYTLGGRRLQNESVLTKARSDSVLLMTSFAHIGTLKQKSSALGYKGRVANIK